MAKRTDIKSILIIGSGPIVVGQACEFDYSGTQACMSLREEGYRVILVNSNPATRMTDPEIASVTYIEPITDEFLTRIIEKERPCALLPTMGGQTALNCAMSLEKNGVLKRFGVELIGAKSSSIEKAESREMFSRAMEKIGLKCPKSITVRSVNQFDAVLEKVGLPAIIRSSFTLGGVGSGIARTAEELRELIIAGIAASPSGEIQVDKSVIGWKEFELEVIRDKNDNCIVVCVIENVDPAGVHTGDSITIAPSLTLRDSEYQRMRDAAIDILREIGVDTGGSNVQFVINPENQDEMLVIEMNPRVSRSSALASKATGFPIAKVAAKLAVGYTLDEIANDCAIGIPASFEPAIDYIVVKFPRFNFDKFKGSSDQLSTSMKSVGEVMAFGRNFSEAFQKGLCSLETGLSGFDEMFATEESIREELMKLSQNRILAVADALRFGLSCDEVADITKYDRYFIYQIRDIVNIEDELRKNGLPADSESMFLLKQKGFSDKRIAKLCGVSVKKVSALRSEMGVEPVYKRVDTCSAEFSTNTAYLYETYERGGLHEKPECESNPSNSDKVIILGSGPNRIGQAIEFDYACVHAVYAVKEMGYEAIMINCNPETVSTDYNISDKLYFVPLVWEYIYAIIQKESKNGRLLGVVLQFGGQTPLKLAHEISEHGIKILGTSFDAINLSEDRRLFSSLMRSLDIPQPISKICFSRNEVRDIIENVKFPIIIRPSYVLGGQSMSIVRDYDELMKYLDLHPNVFEGGSLLIDQFLSGATEVDVDALSDGVSTSIVGLMEHVEEAGVHSGDSACSLPAHTLTSEVLSLVTEYTNRISLAMHICGLMNVQYAVKNGKVFVLEVNPRASRSVPFIAKATGIPVARVAMKLMLGKKLSDFDLNRNLKHTSVKESVFSFSRFPGVDILLGPEMKSTGEVMGIDLNFNLAFAKAQIAAGYKLRLTGDIFISVKDSVKADFILEIAKDLQSQGFGITATEGTCRYLIDNGIHAMRVNKVREGGAHIVDKMYDGSVSLVINVSSGEKFLSDSISIRRAAVLLGIPYSTTLQGARCMADALKVLKTDKFTLKSIQEYYL